eukprot:6194303-Pleurochrysis_carterae.AAC.1
MDAQVAQLVFMSLQDERLFLPGTPGQRPQAARQLVDMYAWASIGCVQATSNTSVRSLPAWTKNEASSRQRNRCSFFCSPGMGAAIGEENMASDSASKVAVRAPCSSHILQSQPM